MLIWETLANDSGERCGPRASYCHLRLQITMSSSSININTASLEYRKSISNIGDKRAEMLLNLREEKRT
jgi:hypothetical protein